MKTLQDYILESEIDDPVNEGKIWDAITNWFKSLISPSKKKYDRYRETIKGNSLRDYEEYIDSSFNIKNIKVVPSNIKQLKDVVYPNGVEPSEKDNIGFWDFVDDVNDVTTDANKDTYKYYVCSYSDKNIKDIICIFRLIDKDKTIELNKFQIIREYTNKFKLIDFIKLLKTVDIVKDKETLIYKKETNDSVYNKLINDCEFEAETIDNENIAQLTL